ncbi:hypothetical protein BASA61_009726 [Batrachochytrium salamandrivorans]|nr:hypothetical protein BASA61_009726 [Batrachochytrium salamandrivorans]
MAENTPSLADAHIVRTYPNDYAPSDTESEGEAQFEVEVEDEEQHSVSTRLEQNQLYMDRQITTTSGETSAWCACWFNCRSLRVRIGPRSKTNIIVGGILARYQYDLRSKTDPHFLNTEGLDLIASEATTHPTFPPGEMWYHSSRGIQSLSAMRFSLEESMKASHLTNPLLRSTKRLKKTVVKPKYFDTPERPTRQSARLQTSSGPESGKKTPSFVSGYANGQPVYTTVRVVPQDIVARIEDEIAIQERKEYQKAN